VQQLKHRLGELAPKTVNNVLTVLSTLLRKAAEWEVIDRSPCVIRLLKTTPGSIDFYDFHEYERLIETAREVDSTSLLLVLLGGRQDFVLVRCAPCAGATSTRKAASFASNGTTGAARCRRQRAVACDMCR